MDLSQSFPRVVYVNGVFDFEGQGLSYQPQHDTIAFVMQQKKMSLFGLQTRIIELLRQDGRIKPNLVLKYTSTLKCIFKTWIR